MGVRAFEQRTRPGTGGADELWTGDYATDAGGIGVTLWVNTRRVTTMKSQAVVRVTGVESRIHVLRNKRVMLDADLAELYGVQTKNLNKAVKRNRERFPDDFMFQLEPKEVADLRFQFGTASPKLDTEMRFRIGTASRRNVRFSPYAFTQEGIAMLSGVLRSPRAVAVNVEIMRAFVRLRRMLVSVDVLARKVEALERKAIAHDTDIQAVFQALRELMTPPTRSRREIGFHARPDE